MSRFPTWGLLCASAILAATSAPADEPAGPSTPAVPSTPSTFTRIKPLPDCPHCRKAATEETAWAQNASSAMTAKAPAGANSSPMAPPANPEGRTTVGRVTPPPAPDQKAAQAQEPTMLDVDVRQVQVPLVPEPPRLRMPTFLTPADDSGPKARILPPSTSVAPVGAVEPSPTSQPPAGPAPEVPTPAGPEPAVPLEVSPAPVPSKSLEGPAIDPASASSLNFVPVMLGDQGPASIHQLLTGPPPVPQRPVPGQPPTPPDPSAHGRSRGIAVVPWGRGFKIADNQSPLPQDRIFYSFNYFNNLNQSINKRLGSDLTSQQAYREMLGIEKTFLGGNASIGARLPIDTLWSGSRDPSVRGNSTAVGNLSVFTKLLLLADNSTGNLLSAGLAVTMPTGPSSFAGSNGVAGFHDVQLQPFLGYVLRRGDLFVQGFSAIDAATDSRDVTMWYNDVAVGYFAYRSADPSAFLSAVIPTFEVHLNDPLNHRGAFRPNDPAGTPDVLDLTFGSSFVLRQRVVASVGCAFPVTGPRPFDFEAMALLNIYFGRSGLGPLPMPPPSAGR